MAYAGEQHAIFQSDLLRSQRGVLRMAAYFLQRGLGVSMPPQTVADSWAERGAHRDQGDLYVNGLRYEIKVYHKWTHGPDWPWPNMMLLAKNRYDNVQPEPRFLFQLRADGRRAAVVNLREVREVWFDFELRDARHPAHLEHHYAIMREQALMIRLDDHWPTEWQL